MQTKNTYHINLAKEHIYSTLDTQQRRENYDPEIMETSPLGHIIWIKPDAPIAKIKKWYFETIGQSLPSYSVLKQMYEAKEARLQARIKQTYRK
jgi:hypothetical protein